MKKTYFYRILITYTLTVWAMIAMVFSGFVMHIQRENEAKLQKYDEDGFLSYVNSYEQVFRGLFGVAANVKNLNSLDLFALSSKDNYYRRLTGLFSELQRMSSMMTHGGYRIAVHKANDDTVITNRNTTRLGTVLEETGLTERRYREMIANLNGKNLYGENVIFTDETLIYISQKDYVDTRMIVLLYAPFSSLNLYPVDARLPVSHLFGDEKIVDLRTTSDRPPFTMSGDAPPGELIRQTSGQADFLLCRSSYLNLTYCYRVKTGLSGETVRLLLRMLALLVLVCAAALLIMLVFSIKIYRPIERVVGTLLSAEPDETTPKQQNEIDYIMQKVMNIRSDNKALVQKLNDNLIRLREQVAMSVLQNAYHEETIQSDLKGTGLEWLDGPVALVLFEFRGADSDLFTFDLDLKEKTLRMLDEQVQARFAAQRTLDYDGRPCFLLRRAPQPPLKKTLSDIITVIDTAFPLSFKAYIGPASETLRQLHSAFAAAGRMVENRQRLPFTSVYDYEECKGLLQRPTVYSLRDESALIAAAENCDAPEAARILDHLFAEFVDKTLESGEQREAILFALANTVNRTLQQTGVECGKIAQGEGFIYEEMRRCETSAQLRKYAGTLYENILKERKNSNQLREQDFRDSLEKFLQENLTSDISLLDLAEHFSLSPNYMSTLFKNTMGDNFKNHISRLRFERAAQILRRDPSVKLADLGRQIGVNHVNTLIRLFKKFCGKSPGQYVKERFGQ